MKQEKFLIINKNILGAILLFFLISLISAWYGFQYFFQGEVKFGYFLKGSILFFFGIFIILFTMLRYQGSYMVKRINKDELGVLLTFISLALTIYFNSFTLPIPAFLFIALLVIFLFIVYHYLGILAVTNLLIIIGVLLLIYLGISVPIEVKAANMLPSIQAACKDIASGNNPYQVQHLDIASVPFYYLPALFLPYCPLELMGIDIRFLNLLILVIIIGVLISSFDYRKSPSILSLTFFPLFLSPVSAQMVYFGHIWGYWLAVLIVVISISVKRYKLAAFFLGVALGIRQLAIFIAVPLTVYMFRKIEIKKFLSYISITLFTFILSILPALVWVEDFIGYFYLNISKTSSSIHIKSGNPFEQITLSAILLHTGISKALIYIQLTILFAGMTFIFLRKNITSQTVMLIIGVCYIFIIGFNPFLSRYLYFPGFILIALSITLGLQTDKELCAYR